MLLIIWAKNGNFFQKCTHSPYFDPNSLDYKCISYSFMVSHNIACEFFIEVYQAIIEVIVTPTTSFGWKEVADDFWKRWNFPQCIGCSAGHSGQRLQIYVCRCRAIRLWIWCRCVQLHWTQGQVWQWWHGITWTWTSTWRGRRGQTHWIPSGWWWRLCPQALDDEASPFEEHDTSTEDFQLSPVKS